MLSLDQYRETILQHLQQKNLNKEPQSLYRPIDYILQLGGKRLRPVLILMMTDIFNGNHKEALDAALAVEIFHNFSLVHDDIMDDAPLRRGKQTVHEKWNINTGILSGDAMLILAYQLFESYEPEVFQKLAKLFSKTAIEVCEGQQYDVDFETRNDVTIPEYLKMIEYKTAVLVAAAMKMGAIIAKAKEADAQKVYDFGLNLGLAFQLKDDYLDAFGDPETFGKQVGGDIIENKKTFLYLKALELAKTAERETLQQLFSFQSVDSSEKVTIIKAIFQNSGATKTTLEAIENYTAKAFALLDDLEVDNKGKQVLRMFGEELMNRSV